MNYAIALSSLFVVTTALAQPPLNVVVTIFPLYDWSRELAGSNATVRQLIPAGVEIHSWAPTPSDVEMVQKANLLVYAGPDLEPWAERIVQSAAARVTVFTAVSHLPPDVAAEGDPHFWTDPVAAISIVRALAQTLAQVDPGGAADYQARARDYEADIARLHHQIQELVRHARRRSIVFAGHRAFDLMGRRYGLTFLTPIEGFSPDLPPTPRALAQLVQAMRESGTRFVFHEEIIEPRIARTIAAECGAELRLLHSLHNRTVEEVRRGETWLSLFRRNLEALNLALNAP